MSSKALVISGADFSGNALDTVGLSEIVPCRSIALSHSALAFEAIGGTATLTATVVPADATYSVFWSTSDPSVATVSGGVIMCVGVGSCTIRAACGERSASCAITATAVYREVDLTRINGYGLVRKGTTDAFSETSGGSTAYAAFAFGQEVAGAYQVAYNSPTPRYGIPLPDNVTKINVRFPGTELNSFTGFYLNFGDSKTAQTSYSGASATYVGAYSLGSSTIGDLTAPEVTVESDSIPEGADMIVVNFRGRTGADPAAWTTPVVITFS